MDSTSVIILTEGRRAPLQDQPWHDCQAETRYRARHREENILSEFVTVGRAAVLLDGEMRAFEAGGERVAVANVGGTYYAFGDTCTHLQCSLAQGDLEDTTVTCPCHGSQFDVTSGAVLRGPAQTPVARYSVRVEGEDLQIGT